MSEEQLKEQLKETIAHFNSDFDQEGGPAALKNFKLLAGEPEIKEAAAGARASELGLVKDPSSEAARSELRALVARLEEAMSAKIKERAASLKDAKTGAKMLQDYHSALVYCCDNYSRVYKLAHEIIKSGEEPGIARYGTAVGVLGELTKGMRAPPRQREEAAEPTTLLADAALAKPAFDEVARRVAAASGARLALAVPFVVDKHGREATGLKSIVRIVQKAQLRPGANRGRTDRVCDVVRGMLVTPDMATIAAVAEALAALQREGVIKVLRIKDRFSHPNPSGWHDLLVNIIVLDGGSGSAVRHVCELSVCFSCHRTTHSKRATRSKQPTHSKQATHFFGCLLRALGRCATR